MIASYNSSEKISKLISKKVQIKSSFIDSLINYFFLITYIIYIKITSNFRDNNKYAKSKFKSFNYEDKIFYKKMLKIKRSNINLIYISKYIYYIS